MKKYFQKLHCTILKILSIKYIFIHIYVAYLEIFREPIYNNKVWNTSSNVMNLDENTFCSQLSFRVPTVNTLFLA